MNSELSDHKAIQLVVLLLILFSLITYRIILFLSLQLPLNFSVLLLTILYFKITQNLLLVRHRCCVCMDQIAQFIIR